MAISQNRFGPTNSEQEMTDNGSDEGSDCTTSERYNIVNNKWSDLPTLNIATVHSAIAYVNGSLYCSGGLCRNTVLNNVWRFAPPTADTRFVWSSSSSLCVANPQLGSVISLWKLMDTRKMLNRGWSLLHDNARLHNTTCAIRDLLPLLEFHLFTKLKELLGRIHFSNDEVKNTEEKWLSEVERSVFDEGIKTLVHRLKK
ncbi:hypothetical protein AAG570_013379 [Ranatra chinensis]|uniref:Uncharacterized protein n=1 Tax=Ranatra chinensis TaxID=642074 RepID=A0ABD0YC03_9HEMI